VVHKLSTLTVLRFQAELSQQDLGNEAGLSQAYISEFERGLAIPSHIADRLIRTLQPHLPPEWKEIEITRADLSAPWVGSRLQNLTVK
jgi:transcriptional regulator with XRE-family HTH domain